MIVHSKFDQYDGCIIRQFQIYTVSLAIRPAPYPHQDHLRRQAERVSGSWATITAIRISAQPAYSRAVMRWDRMIAPPITANTDSMLKSSETIAGSPSRWAIICSRYAMPHEKIAT